jgi:hypothetical protein
MSVEDNTCFICRVYLLKIDFANTGRNYIYDSHLLSCECRRKYMIGKICANCHNKLMNSPFNHNWINALINTGVDFDFIKRNKVIMFNKHIFNGLTIYVVKKYTYCALYEGYVEDLIYYCNDCLGSLRYTINLY